MWPFDWWCLKIGCCGLYGTWNWEENKTEGRRELNTEEHHKCNSSPNIIRAIKSKRIRWAGHTRNETDIQMFVHKTCRNRNILKTKAQIRREYNASKVKCMMSGFNLLRMESSEHSNEPSGSTWHSTMQRDIEGHSETLAPIYQTRWCHIPKTVNPLLTVMKTKISFRQDKFQQNMIHRYGISFSQYSKRLSVFKHQATAVLIYGKIYTSSLFCDKR